MRAAGGHGGEAAHSLRVDPVAAVRVNGEVVAREPERMVRQRGGREVVGGAVRKVPSGVEVAHDDGLPLRERLELGRRVERERQLRPGVVALLVEAWVVGAVGSSLDERTYLLGRRRAPGDRAAFASNRARRERSRASQAVVAGQVEWADAKLAPVAPNLC